MRRERKINRTLYLADSCEIKTTLQLSVGALCLIAWVASSQDRVEELMLCSCGHLGTNATAANLGFLKWNASLKARYASCFWNPWRNCGPTKSKSKVWTRAGGLICQTLVRCCHQNCCKRSFIYKECQPERKIRSIITTKLSWSNDRWLFCMRYQDRMWHFCLTVDSPLVKWASQLSLSCRKTLIPKSYKVDLGPSFPFID